MAGLSNGELPDGFEHTRFPRRPLFTTVRAHHPEATATLPPETHRQVLRRRIHAFVQHNLHDPGYAPRSSPPPTRSPSVTCTSSSGTRT
ncbi:hypothetical protein ABT340_19160 [Streptosporangium sp. NPDC000239]|uniref:hypothetical protein n=1 Tax=Streptosporangium sp. NPDC000239 TaxID=3154248 RepID=UPI00331E238E